MQQKICPSCKTPASLDSKFCSQCGHTYRTVFTDQTRLTPPQQQFPHRQQQEPFQYPPHAGEPGYIYSPGKSPGLSIVCGLLFTGCGQMANGQVGKGFLIFFLTATAGYEGYWIPVFAMWLISLIDAPQVASRLQRGEVITLWQFF